jgi:hypothetical protein
LAQEHVVFSDDFNRPDSGTLGNGWIDSSQKGLIESATLKLSGLADSFSNANTRINRPEQRLNQTISIDILSGGIDELGILGRIQSTTPLTSYFGIAYSNHISL